MINKGQLTRLRNRLKKIPKYRDKLHEETGFSTSYIDYVLNPNDSRYNQDVIDVAFNLLEKHKEEQKEKLKAQKQLLKKN